jgi:hypothetical protein
MRGVPHHLLLDADRGSHRKLALGLLWAVLEIPVCGNDDECLREGLMDGKLTAHTKLLESAGVGIL